MKIIVYDCEIERAIPPKHEPTYPDLEYCGGWRDFQNMGLSLVTVWDLEAYMPRIFMRDNIEEFFKLVESADRVVGFNNKNFDDQLLAAIGCTIFPGKSFDLLRAIWHAAGLDPSAYNPRTHSGYGLHDCCVANFEHGKLGQSTDAPIWYQRGQLGRLVDYGLWDTALTVKLLEACCQGPIVNPKPGGAPLNVHIPFAPDILVNV